MKKRKIFKMMLEQNGVCAGVPCNSDTCPLYIGDCSRERCVREATKWLEEHPKEKTFKVGDKVKLRKMEKYKYGQGSVSPGDIGTIICINGIRIEIEFPTQSSWSGIASELKKVKKSSIKEEVKEHYLKSGDKFTINGETYVYLIIQDQDKKLFSDNRCVLIKDRKFVNTVGPANGYIAYFASEFEKMTVELLRRYWELPQGEVTYS